MGGKQEPIMSMERRGTFLGQAVAFTQTETQTWHSHTLCKTMYTNTEINTI